MAIFNCASPTRIPTYRCVIADRIRDFRPVSCSGVGTHGLASVAVIRAITEAAQSRATIIAGSRDDRYPSLYDAAFRDAASAGATGPPPPACSFAEYVQELTAPSPAAECELVLGRLGNAGANRVVAVDLTRPELRLPVVRVAAEGFLLPGAYAP
jgi:ribosomal protein S12 methylthiotransferase accessory factor